MAKNFSFIWAIIAVLGKFNAIQQTIWPCKGDTTTKKTKAEANNNLAFCFVKDIL